MVNDHSQKHVLLGACHGKKRPEKGFTNFLFTGEWTMGGYSACAV